MRPEDDWSSMLADDVASLLDRVDKTGRESDPRSDSEIRLAIARRIPELPFLLDYLTGLDRESRTPAERRESRDG